MPWPSVRKHVFAYILNRLQLFTQVDADKLEVSGSSVCVENVEIDVTRLPAVPGVTLTRATLASVTVALSTQGVLVDVSGLTASAIVDQLEPDLALSTILERTRMDIETEFAADDEETKDVGYGIGDVSGIVSRLADIALAQLNVKVSDSLLYLELGEVTYEINVGLIKFDADKIVDIHEIAVSCSQSEAESIPASVANESTDEEEEEEYEDPMAKSIMVGSRNVRFAPDLAQSVYFDTVESSPSSEYLTNSLDVTERLSGTVATVDHAKFSYSATKLELDVDTIHVQLIPAVYAMVQVLNYALEGQSMGAEEGATPPIEPVSITSTIGRINIEDSGAVSSVVGIKLDSPSITVETLVVPGVLTAPTAPIFVGSISGNHIAAEVEAPLSFAIPSELTAYAADLTRQVTQALAHLQAPPNSSPTPLSVKLPELRLAFGEITAIVFPESLTNTGLSLSEVTVVARDGQVLVRDLAVKFAIQPDSFPSISIGDIHALITRGSQEALHNLLNEITLTGQSADEEEESAFGIPLPDIKVSRLLADVTDYNGLVITAHDISAAGRAGSVGLVDVTKDKNKCTCSVKMNLLNSSTCVVDITDFSGDLWPFADTESHSEKPNTISGGITQLPNVAIKVSVKGSMVLHSDDYALRADAKCTVDVIGGVIVAVIPKVTLAIVDEATDVVICEAHETEANIRQGVTPMEATLVISRLVWDCCPDSYQAALEILTASLPRSVMPAFSLDPNGTVDILEDVELEPTEKTQVAEDAEDRSPIIDIDDSQHLLDIGEQPSVSQTEDIEVNEAYMGLKPVPQEISAWEKGVVSVIRLRIVRTVWRLYDGFDLSSTRNSIADAIESLESAAADYDAKLAGKPADTEDEAEKEDEDSDDDVVVGNLLYNSVFIGKALRSQDDLRDSVETAIGTKSLARSPKPKLVLKAASLTVHTHHFAVSEGVYNRTEIRLSDVIVEDKVETSKFEHLFERQNKQGRLLSIDVELVNPDAPEQRLYVNVLPLRIRLDQDTLEYLTRFFTFDLHARTSTTDDDVEPAASTFIQRAEIMDIGLLIDYHPKKFDYAGLRSGYTAELMNIFVLEEAKLTLRHVILHGLSGMDRLGDELLQIWGPEIRANQLGGILGGLGPIRSMLRLANGQAGTLGKSAAVKNVKRGASIFIRRTASGFLKLLDS